MGLRVAAANPGSTIFLMILGVSFMIVFQYLLWRGLIGYGLCWVINGGDYSFSDDFKFWPFLPICNIKCEKEQCSNNGTGEVSGMIYGDCNCSCDTGYSGDKCQTSVSAPNPPAPGEPPAPASHSPCASISCNGSNRTKKSDNEISAISSSTDSSDYSDATFRSPCCKWGNISQGGVDYTDFLNDESNECPLKQNNSNVTQWVQAGARGDTTVDGRAGPRKCGAYTIPIEVSPGTPSDILEDGQFNIRFIHDNPNRAGCPETGGTAPPGPPKCFCPRTDTGEYFNLQVNNNWDSDAPSSTIRCNIDQSD
tara:strand:- start:291 stop:1217 length:927 start_codon:yes stop_codon:yes gene_type:complete